ncbi:MAG: hypothetical protein IKW00_06695 [Clostridia bacterium]|nr:hypothetical protein [Clostridia bacterium]
MNRAFFVMIFAGFTYAVINCNVAEAAESALAAGGEALETVLELCGAFMFFGGITQILERAGATGAAVGLLKKPLRKLFGSEISDEALGAVTMNLSANMFGMGNAATPMGLKASKLLNPDKRASAPAALCLLLVLNSTAIELFPATVVAMRYAAGSKKALAVVFPTLISTSVSCIVGIVLCKLCERRKSR